MVDWRSTIRFREDFRRRMTLFERMGLSVLLLAPTGRAAQRMGQLCSRDAQTIHRSLGMSYNELTGEVNFRKNEKEPLECDAVIVESNHDVAMLIEGPYPEYLKHRILSHAGHLSNESCAKLCTYLAEQGTKRFMLAHLSKENNTPGLALRSASALSEAGVRVFTSSDVSPVCLYEE